MVDEESPSSFGHGPRLDAGARGDRFAVEQITTGSHASGFGRTQDDRPFAFRVSRATMLVEIYRADVLTPVPDKNDVAAVSEQSVAEIDLTDERSIIAVVREAVNSADELGAGAEKESSAIRSCLGRVGSVLEAL